MLSLIKHLKKSIFPILLIIGLLAIQAACDLALPDYTSKIVNVGISQGGIENSVPDAIRKSEYDKLTALMKDEDKKLVGDNYLLINTSNFNEKEYDKLIKKYPDAKVAEVYKFNSKDKDTINSLDGIFAKSITKSSAMEKVKAEIEQKIKEATEKAKQAAQAGGAQAQIPPQAQQGASAPNMADIEKSVDDKIKDLPEMVLKGAGTKYVKEEYKALGVDTDKLQNNAVIVAGLQMIALTLASVLAVVLVGFLGARVAASLGRDLRSKTFNKVMRFSNTELDKFSSASLITRTTNDIQQIQTLMVMLLRIVFYAPIIAVGGIIKVVNTDNNMTWIIGIAVGSIIVVVGALFAVAIPKFKIVQKLIDRVNLVMREILTGVPVIRAFGTETHEEKRFDKANSDLTKTNLFVTRTMAIMMPLMMFIMNGITVLIVWVGAKNIDNGSMQVGDMMAFIQYAMQIIMAFLFITMVSVMLPRAAVSAQRVQEILDTDIIIADPAKTENFENSKKGIVQFNNVSFKYPNADEDVLSNISFTAEPGKTTAFIGSTGSGKSTLINLIPRFYDVTEGEVLVDGVDVRNVLQHDLREKIGYVPQKGMLFTGNIESNIKYGKDEASMDEVQRAAEIAQATEFINAKPEKYETAISQGGSNVSGGQKQRLSIARAIAKRPDIYIFDDSFSALDYKTDIALRKSLKENTGNSTLLIVAQRISTIVDAEQIIVLDEGRIVGKGTHKELIENCEVYKQIALSQLSKEELANE